MHDMAKLLKRDDPKKLKLLKRAYSLDKKGGSELGEQYVVSGNDAAAAEIFESMIASGTSPIGAATKCAWLIDYYLEHGRRAEAKAAAEFGADVYSWRGLAAAVTYYAAVGDGENALRHAEMLIERYPNSSPYPMAAMVTRFPDLATRAQKQIAEKHISKYFPEGIVKVTKDDFVDGILPPLATKVIADSPLLLAAGLKVGDIIVANDGYRIGDIQQGSFIRELKSGNSKTIIYADESGTYHEVTAKTGRFRTMGYRTENYISDEQ